MKIETSSSQKNNKTGGQVKTDFGKFAGQITGIETPAVTALL